MHPARNAIARSNADLHGHVRVAGDIRLKFAGFGLLWMSGFIDVISCAFSGGCSTLGPNYGVENIPLT
jgi:hypothetical protein